MAGKSVFHVLLVSCVALLGVASTWQQAEAARYRRGRGRSSSQTAAARRQATIQQAQAQIAAAKQVLSAAEYKGANAQGRLSEAMGKLQHAASDADKANDAVNSLQTDLLKIEAEILSEQGKTSDYYKTHEELNEAKKEMAAAKAEVMAKPEVISELEPLKGVARAKALNDRLESSPRYVGAHNRVAVASHQLERIKSQLFHADSDWKETNKALNDMKDDIAVAKREASIAGFSRLKPLGEYREASQAAGAARAAIAQAEGVLKALNANAKPTSSSSSKKK